MPRSTAPMFSSSLYAGGTIASCPPLDVVGGQAAAGVSIRACMTGLLQGLQVSLLNRHKGQMDFFNRRCSGTDNGNSGFTLNCIVNLDGGWTSTSAEDRHAGRGGHGLDGRFPQCRQECRSVRNRWRASRSRSTSHCRSSRCMNGSRIVQPWKALESLAGRRTGIQFTRATRVTTISRS